MKILRIDFETRGTAELSGQKSVGLYNYATHPDTRVLMLAYKLPGSQFVQLWQPHLGPMPADLLAALLEPTVFISAFNSAFERYILQYQLGITIHPSRFLDPQVSCRYLTLPASLGGACEVLRMPAHLQKDKRGEDLIDLFSIPKKRSKKQGGALYFNDWETHPMEWQEFCEYCMQDVVAEEEVMRRLTILQAFPLPEFEHRLWVFDQIVNDRGMPVDVRFVTNAYALATRAKEEKQQEINALTGLENANSTTQLLPWVQERGYEFKTLRKETVEAVLKDPESKITPECRAVLQARREASSTSYTKLAAILRQVCNDGRTRGMFVFMGSSRCGRWAGSVVQPHNMARPNGTFEKKKNLDDARTLIYAGDYEGLKKRFEEKDKTTGLMKPGNVLLIIKNVIRTVFVAPELP
jgi:DNA polymerase bacteriophage-type